MRRGLCAATAGVVVALSATPPLAARAYAQLPPPNVSVQLTAPADGSVNGAPVTTSGSAHTTGQFQPTITWIRGDLQWNKTGSSPPLPKPLAICGPAPGPDKPGAPCQGSADVSFTNAATPQPAMNGPFKLVVTAHADDGVGGSNENAATVAYGLAIPPPKIANVTAAVDKTRQTTVSWDRDAMTPDVQAYYVLRKGPGDQEFTAVLQTLQQNSGVRISVVDSSTQYKGGSYTYEVETRRNGASGDNRTVVASDPTKSQSNAVTVPDPPPGTPPAPPTQPPAANGGAPPVVHGTPSGVSRSSGFSGSSAGSGSSSAGGTPTSEAVTPDPGFVRGLPYAAGSSPGDNGNGDGNNSAVAVTPGRHRSGSRGLLVPVAAGAVLFVGALHLRILKKRLDEPPSTGLTPAA